MFQSFPDKNLPEMQRVDYFKHSLISYEPPIKTNLNIYEFSLKYNTKNESKVKSVSQSTTYDKTVLNDGVLSSYHM